MQVNKSNVSQFLTATNITFVVPVYQRNYDWSETNCEQLWRDVWYIAQNEHSGTHFLGTICSKTANGREKTIIDGQQRLTTISLMMKAMHDYVGNPQFKNDIDANYLHNTGYGVSEIHKVKLHLNRRDDAVFNRLLEFSEFVQPDNLMPDQAHSRIYKNYRFFYECFEGLTEEQIVNVRLALDRIVIVDLDVENENPQEIFESLNSTGLDLTDVDLLRNYLLMSLDYETQVRLYDDYWYRIEENVHPDNMVRFFIDYLIYVKKSDATMVNGRRAHINENNLYAAFKQYYKTLSGVNERYTSSPEATESVLASMFECSKVYKHLIFDGVSDMNHLKGLDRTIFSIVSANQAVASRPVLIYIMQQYLSGRVDEKAAKEMLDACLSLVFRARVCRSYGINGQFAGIVLQHLPETADYDIVDQFWKAITSGNGAYAFPPDNVFRDALINRPIFDVIRAKGVKYLFYALEQHSIAAKGLPRFDDMFLTVEHIMPKKLSEEWEKHLGDDVAYHDSYINRLGNLALTNNNSEMSNSAFGQKRDWYRESSFSFTRQLAENSEWTIRSIAKRGNKLAERCIEIWSIPKEYQPEIDLSTPEKKRPAFKFSMIGLSEGDEVSFIGNPSKIAVVADENHVEYDGERYSLSGLAAKLLGRSSSNGTAGPNYFEYEGEKLSDRRDRMEM